MSPDICPPQPPLTLPPPDLAATTPSAPTSLRRPRGGVPFSPPPRPPSPPPPPPPPAGTPADLVRLLPREEEGSAASALVTTSSRGTSSTSFSPPPPSQRRVPPTPVPGTRPAARRLPELALDLKPADSISIFKPVTKRAQQAPVTRPPRSHLRCRRQLLSLRRSSFAGVEMVKTAIRYEPGPAFQESLEEDTLEIPPSDSTELWLIQWPINHVDASDFHGKEVSLKLHHDGNLGNLEDSLGKSYELVSFAAQQPDATVFVPSGSEMKAAGKISRRVCLVRYPEPQELEREKPGFGSTPGSKRSAGSSRKTMSRFTSGSKNRSSQGSAFSLGQRSAEPASKHKKRRRDESSLGHSEKSSQGSQARDTESNTTSEMPQMPVEKSKKKKKVRIAE